MTPPALPPPPFNQGPDEGLAVVLQTLKEAQEPVSGQALAARVGVSRAAIWKRIHRLKALGYAITGESRRGYRLLQTPDKLLPLEIGQGLRARYLKGPIHHFPVAASTNDLAKELGARGAPEGTLVVAEGQTAGRGRLGRRWESPPGLGLYASVLLRPPLPPAEMPRLTLTTAVAAVRGLRRATGLTLGVKWPNDLLLAGKKVGGILTEIDAEIDQIRFLVVGLGLNVNNAGFSAGLESTATSLALVAGRTFPRLPILKAWLEEFDALYGCFLNRQFAEILEEWKSYTETLGQWVRVRQGGQEITGLAVEVAGDGALLLKTDAGPLVRVISGELAPAP